MYAVALNDYFDLERLLASVRESGEALRELRLEETDLEEVFMQIMRRE